MRIEGFAVRRWARRSGSCSCKNSVGITPFAGAFRSFMRLLGPCSCFAEAAAAQEAAQVQRPLTYISRIMCGEIIVHDGNLSCKVPETPTPLTLPKALQDCDLAVRCTSMTWFVVMRASTPHTYLLWGSCALVARCR